MAIPSIPGGTLGAPGMCAPGACVTPPAFWTPPTVASLDLKWYTWWGDTIPIMDGTLEFVASDVTDVTNSGTYTYNTVTAPNQTVGTTTVEVDTLSPSQGLPTIEHKDDYAVCDCKTVQKIDPVYAKAYLMVGVGIGLDRSKTVLCRASEENLGNVTNKGCPIRDIDYIVHINRITESHTINRSQNVKSKN